MNPLINFAKGFKGFIKFAAFILLVLLALIYWLFPRGAFAKAGEAFGTLTRDQFFYLTCVVLIFLFIITLLLIFLSYVRTAPPPPRPRPGRPPAHPPVQGGGWMKRNQSLLISLAIAVVVGITIGVAIRYFPESEEVDSLAVLPFINVGAEPGKEFICDGVTRSLIDNISKIPNINVTAPASVFYYKGRGMNPLDVGRELGVRAVLTGQITSSSDNIVIEASLDDVRDNHHIWGNRYPRNSSDMHKLMLDVAQVIAEELGKRLTPAVKNQLSKPETKSSEAYELYLQGRYFWSKRTGEDFIRAIEYFNKAIEKDPDYALAYAGLADSYNLLTNYQFLTPKDAFTKAREAAEKAIKLDEELAEAHTSLAYEKMRYERDWEGTEREFKRALELKPKYPTAHDWYAEYLMAQGRQNEALEHMSLAASLDPFSLIINADYGWNLIWAGQYDPAIKQFNKTLSLAQDHNFVPALFGLGVTYEQIGKYTEAIAELQKAIDLQKDNTRVIAALAHVYAVSGRRGEAQKVLDDLKEKSKQRIVSPYNLALIYAALGDKDRAFALLREAYEMRIAGASALRVEPRLAGLRSDPRFTEIMRSVGLNP